MNAPACAPADPVAIAPAQADAVAAASGGPVAESGGIAARRPAGAHDPAAAGCGYPVSVRELCAFTSKAGDLDLRFTPSPTAAEGVAGHQTVAARRPPPYRAELALAGDLDGLRVRGRADGWDPVARRIDEVKTHRGDLARQPANHRALHWAQAETYAWLKCAEDGLAAIGVALVYFDVATQRETRFERELDAATLRARFADRCARFAAWAAREVAHRTARDAALAALSFPHAAFRAGQRELAQAVYRTARDGGCVLAQAPTGIGKTLATLFATLKAMAPQRLDKVFFLTAKTSGRQLAVDALRTLAGPGGAPLRVVELVARDTACEHPDKACHGESCPLARGFYDRLAAARDAAVAQPLLDRARLREVAAAHAVCPYYLGQELVRWADVVVGDYNHYFDAAALLHATTLANEWRVAVLVDEAHNLVERARAMYSAELRRADLRAQMRAAPAALKRPLARLDRVWKGVVAAQTEPYRVHAAGVPAAFADALDAAVAAIGAFQAERPDAVDAALLRLFFDAAQFARLAARIGPHSVFDSTRDAAGAGARRAADSRLCLRNVVPAPHLAPRFAAAHAVALFSATFAPDAFYRATLGVPAGARSIDVDSPFEASQLAVRIATHISTRFADRGRSLAPIVALIAAQFDAAPGNYIAFLSSFDYLQQVADALARSRPDIAAWRQAPRMDEAAQAAFLARFDAGGRGVGFAVLGGRFAEGIDLPGDRLIGAFVATLGLPQVNPVNEQMRRTMQAQFGDGYAFTYLYPGLRKVVQAAGRVIRDRADRGVVHLIDDRFARARVRRLLPRWWDVGGADRAG